MSIEVFPSMPVCHLELHSGRVAVAMSACSFTCEQKPAVNHDFIENMLSEVPVQEDEVHGPTVAESQRLYRDNSQLANKHAGINTSNQYTLNLEELWSWGSIPGDARCWFSWVQHCCIEQTFRKSNPYSLNLQQLRSMRLLIQISNKFLTYRQPPALCPGAWRWRNGANASIQTFRLRNGRSSRGTKVCPYITHTCPTRACVCAEGCRRIYTHAVLSEFLEFHTPSVYLLSE